MALRYLGLVFCCVCVGPIALGQSHSWNAAVSGNWATASLWNVNDVPDQAADDVLIAAVGSAYTVTYNTSTVISQLTLNSTNATFSMNASTALTVSTLNIQNGAFNINSATLNLGTLNLTGGTATISSNGTINGGTILATAGLSLSNSGTATLNNVTLGDGVNAGVIRLNTGSSWQFQGTTDFQTGYTATITGLTNLRYMTTKTIAADVILQNGGIESGTAGQTITIGAGRSISRSGTGSGGGINGVGHWVNDGTIQTIGNGSQMSIGSSQSFINNGIILAQSSGSTLGALSILNSISSFTNNGTLRATANGQLSLQENVTTAQLGNWDTTGGGIVEIRQITLDNTSSTLDMTVARGSFYTQNTTINSGTIQAAAGLRLALNGSTATTLNNVILGGANGNLDVLRLNAGGTWSFQGTTDFQAGFSPTLSNATSIDFLTTRTLVTDFSLQDGNLRSGSSQTITIDTGRNVTRTVSGSGGQIQGAGNWINDGTIQVAGNGSTLSISGSGAFTNNGTILAQSSGGSNGTVTIFNSVSSFTNTGTLRTTTNGILTLQENVTTAQFGNWDTTGGGEVRLNNTLSNSGDTLDLTAARGNLFLNNAIINGGTVQAVAGLRLAFAGGSAATLNNVILGGANGNLDVLRLNAGGTWSFQGTTDFQAGFSPSVSNLTRLYYLSSLTMAMDLTLAQGTVESNTAGQTITIGTGRTITATTTTSNNIQGAGNWINDGTIQVAGNGSTLSISGSGAFTNNGTILAQSSGGTQASISMNPTTLTNYNTGTFTLTDGTYQALTRGTISSGTREFRNLAGTASVELGLNSVFAAVEGKLTTIGVNASFRISGGKTYSVTNVVNSFTNNGVIRVTGVGSQLTIPAGINLTNYNVGTQSLTGGIFEVFNGGAINLGTRTTNTIQNGTRVVLDGSTSAFSVIEGGLLSSLQGQLNVNNGKSLTIAATGLTISNGGMLSGHLGIVTGGTVIVASTGTIAPGNSPGQITIGGGLDVGGNLELDISQGNNNNSNAQGNTTPGSGFDTIAQQAPPGTNVTIRTNANFRLVAGNVNLNSAFWSVPQSWTFVKTMNGVIQFSSGVAGEPITLLNSLPTPNVSIIDAANGNIIDYSSTWPTASFQFQLSSFETGQDLRIAWDPVPEPSLVLGMAGLLMLGYKRFPFRKRRS